MRVLVAGASGVVGRYLVPMLVEHGHEVFGTATSPEALQRIAEVGASGVVMDALDAAAVRRAVRESRPEAIIHQMTALKGKPDFKHFDRWFARTNELRTTGTENLLAAARESGATTRMVVQSYTGWTNAESGDGPATEDEPLDPAPLTQQRATLEAIARLERSVLEAPIDAVVLRYANLYSRESMQESVRLLRRRQFPIVGSGAAVWSWVHAADAAAAAVLALEAGSDRIYNVADDDPAPVATWLPYLADVVGAPKPMRVPAWLAKPLIGEVGVRMMTRARGVSNARIKRELGWAPSFSSWREGFRTIAADERTAEPAHAV